MNKASDTGCKEQTSGAALAYISVSTKLPEFWTDLPRLWFAQFEAVMTPQKQGVETKFNMVISKLGKEAIQQVSDLVMSPPAQDKYTALKERLLHVYEESAERQMQKLVSEFELGSQRPSQFLRRIKDLGRSAQIADTTLKSLWLSKMPASIRAVMAVCEDQSLDKLAAMADKITEYTNVGDVAVVSSKRATEEQLDEQMSRLEMEIAALRNELRSRGRSRSSNRPTDFRRRSSSRPRRVPTWGPGLAVFTSGTDRELAVARNPARGEPSSRETSRSTCGRDGRMYSRSGKFKPSFIN